MKTQVHKISGNKNHIHTDAFKKSDANSSTLLRTKGNTGTAMVQQKLQDALNASPRLHQLKAYQEMADTHAFLHNKPAPKKQTGITANTVHSELCIPMWCLVLKMYCPMKTESRPPAKKATRKRHPYRQIP